MVGRGGAVMVAFSTLLSINFCPEIKFDASQVCKRDIMI